MTTMKSFNSWSVKMNAEGRYEEAMVIVAVSVEDAASHARCAFPKLSIQSIISHDPVWMLVEVETKHS